MGRSSKIRHQRRRRGERSGLRQAELKLRAERRKQAAAPTRRFSSDHVAQIIARKRNDAWRKVQTQARKSTAHGS